MARLAGVPLYTAQKYYKAGLLPPPRKLDSGDPRSRYWTQDAVVRLKIIRDARLLGLSVANIQEIFGLQGPAERDLLRERVLARVQALEERIQAMQSLCHNLKQLLDGET
ncbi:MAG: MerR family DNA-binding protein [Candidatus Eremiobacterota bacterium]